MAGREPMMSVCGICGVPADCVGWVYPSNGDSSVDLFYCTEHCDHDCCSFVKRETEVESGTS